jgi:lactate dehydrogenase-like 2-hydroxyacid dehydrogenase
MASRLSVIRSHIVPVITRRPAHIRTMSSSPSTPSIAILDDYGGIAAKHFTAITGLKVDSFPETLNPASEEGLQALASRLKHYTIISTMRERTPFPATLQSQLPNLKLLLTTGVRNASLDIPAAISQGIVIAGTTGAKPGHPDHSAKESTSAPPPPGYDSTTQHTWALILSLCSRIPQDNAALRTDPKIWQSGFSLALGGKTLGLCGLGKLGANAARIGAQAFGMNVIAWSENLTQEKADAAAESAGLPRGSFKAVSKAELFQTADVISLHYVLSPRSRGIVGAEELAMMKSSSVLINSSRGPLIDEGALLATLERGGIRGAALDVWWQEPLPEDSPWRHYKGKSELVMSPHMGYVNEGKLERNVVSNFIITITIYRNWTD